MILYGISPGIWIGILETDVVYVLQYILICDAVLVVWKTLPPCA